MLRILYTCIHWIFILFDFTVQNGVETNEARILKLVSYLRRRDYNCFTRFLWILNETHNEHVRERLEMPPLESYPSGQ